MFLLLSFVVVFQLFASCCIAWLFPPPRYGYSKASASLLFTSESLRERQDEESQSILMSALLNISYDGAHFTGWSAANQESPEDDDDNEHQSSLNDSHSSIAFRPSRRRRRRSGRSPKSGYIRSVEGVFQKRLAKLFGNVDPSLVMIEGCSRTDKGVHAQSMIAQIYCLSSTASTCTTDSNFIPGKKLPHPSSSWDDSSCFQPIPMDLPKLMYVLNRMLPHDVKVMAVAPVPKVSNHGVFHPSLRAQTKTYCYTFSVGELQDPTQWRTTWHLEYETDFSIDKARHVCKELLLGTHDFVAFRGAPRGSDDKRRQEQESTICTLSQVDIDERVDTVTFPGLSLSTYTVTITGDRFLYKMVRFLVGAIVAVGTGNLTMDDVQSALESGSWDAPDGRKQFTCAPPHGLILKNVSYKEPIEWSTCSNRKSTV